MNAGKRTCRILKDIRKQIADANGIELLVSECTYRGNCSGTCPKCESELQYLYDELDARRKSGKTVILAGLSAGLLAASLSMSSCGNRSNENIALAINEQPQDTVQQEQIVDTTTVSVDSIQSTKANGVLNRVIVTELLIAGDPRPIIKGVYDFPIRAKFSYAGFIGGNEKLNDYLLEALKGIQDNSKYDISIKTWAVIDESGRVESLHKSEYGCDEIYWNEIDKILLNLPRFIPGTVEDKPVKSFFDISFDFYSAKREKEAREQGVSLRKLEAIEIQNDTTLVEKKDAASVQEEMVVNDTINIEQ